ncbi:hypothetical protein [Actinomadura violacea]|uniref:Uncharacterized protein n=1 Tax=Actinomadura violacea TaxID=2819934 RepID=A0ABS3S1E3_9ACTN|nr:hypothetical protein [Actinomadura violacea]MBO2462782.1 hypothetical protein [Actinomadura violacea]
MPSGPPDPGRAARRAVAPLMSACVVLVVAINLSIPKLSASGLHPSATGLLWIVDSYVLVFGCLLIPARAAGAVGNIAGGAVLEWLPWRR